jgi:hypothetical protein
MLAHSPKYNADGTIDLIYTHPKLGEIPFTVSSADNSQIVSSLYTQAMAGEFGKIYPFVTQQSVPIVPAQVSRFQARAALAQAGLFTTVDTYMATLPADNIQRLAWNDALTFDRDSTTVAAMATMLHLTSAQIDQLFIAASKIKA